MTWGGISDTYAQLDDPEIDAAFHAYLHVMCNPGACDVDALVAALAAAKAVREAVKESA